MTKEAEHKFDAMLRERAMSAESTRKKLDAALDRFQHNKLEKLPAGSKLTVRNLAIEAGVSKDTPLSRYPKGHQKAGEYRFPEIVRRFRKLKAKKTVPRPNAKDEIIKELKADNLKLARANNQLDAENLELKREKRELEEANAQLREENAKLRQGKIKVLS